MNAAVKDATIMSEEEKQSNPQALTSPTPGQVDNANELPASQSPRPASSFTVAPTTVSASPAPAPPRDLEKNDILATSSPAASAEDGRSSSSGGEDARTTATTAPPDSPSSAKAPLRALSFLDRFLVVWILLAMALGIALSNTVPGAADALQRSTFAGVSVPIAVGLLVMMYPILCKVRFEALLGLLAWWKGGRRDRDTRGRGSGDLWRQLLLSFVINWIFAPLLMTGLAWAFLPDRPDLREGLILVGIARCIAMVLIWTDLAGGDGDYCAVLVAVNSLLQLVLFAPLAVLYVKVIGGSGNGDGGVAISVSAFYALVARSVGVFLGLPLAAAAVTRLALFPALGARRYALLTRWLGPLSLLGLLYTIAVLFASQGRHVASQITSVLRVCAPLVVYFAVTFAATLWACRRRWGPLRLARPGYRVACAQSFTAASNNFELAIAVAVATFGAGSGQALASAVGPLIEVPVLVGLVYVMRWCRSRWQWED